MAVPPKAVQEKQVAPVAGHKVIGAALQTTLDDAVVIIVCRNGGYGVRR